MPMTSWDLHDWGIIQLSSPFLATRSHPNALLHSVYHYPPPADWCPTPAPAYQVGRWVWRSPRTSLYRWSEKPTRKSIRHFTIKKSSIILHEVSVSHVQLPHILCVQSKVSPWELPVAFGSSTSPSPDWQGSCPDCAMPAVLPSVREKVPVLGSSGRLWAWGKVLGSESRHPQLRPSRISADSGKANQFGHAEELDPFGPQEFSRFELSLPLTSSPHLLTSAQINLAASVSLFKFWNPDSLLPLTASPLLLSYLKALTQVFSHHLPASCLLSLFAANSLAINPIEWSINKGHYKGLY